MCRGLRLGQYLLERPDKQYLGGLGTSCAADTDTGVGLGSHKCWSVGDKR